MPQRQNIGRELAKAAIEIIAKSEGSVGLAELYAALKAKFGLKVCDDSKKDKLGRPRWKKHLGAYSSPSLTGGKPLFEKGNGEWSLTEYGWEWFERLKSESKNALPELKPKESAHTDSGLTEEEQQVADYVFNKEPPEGKSKGTWFEYTVAALLRGMGYGYVNVTQQSWDGGVDVVAYEDDLGIKGTRLKVQVKHQKNKVDHGVIMGLANVVHEGEVGVCVTSSSFNRGAKDFALISDKHLLLVPRERFAQLWVKHRDDMSQEDRDRIPVSVKDKKSRKGKKPRRSK